MRDLSRPDVRESRVSCASERARTEPHCHAVPAPSALPRWQVGQSAMRVPDALPAVAAKQRCAPRPFPVRLGPHNVRMGWSFQQAFHKARRTETGRLRMTRDGTRARRRTCLILKKEDGAARVGDAICLALRVPRRGPRRFTRPAREPAWPGGASRNRFRRSREASWPMWPAPERRERCRCRDGPA